MSDFRARLQRAETRQPPAVRVRTADPLHPGWSVCPATGGRMRSAVLAGDPSVLHVTLDLGADRRGGRDEAETNP